MTEVFTVAIALLVLALLVVIAIAVMRKKPGLRRRGEDPSYEGPGRRFTDFSADDPENDDDGECTHVKMDSYTGSGSKK